ncbi:thiamine phosphate synthase [Fusobacterium sp.]|uniref:thiamine phosphate synthase n=1 Tax=Fusobacterium sp. TaxID=68766 RepID=UPI00261A0A95|nr:thiamine phosphate synthase [Fusobacterium sp.]
MNKKNIDYSVYLVTDRGILGDRDLYKSVEESILGGVTLVQLREKNIDDEKFLEIAKKLKEITDKYKVPLIINDNVKVAKLVDADGVHIGQSDEELTEARKELGDNKIIGVSVSNIEEALKAQRDGADYLGIGAIFFTGSKKDINVPIGLENLKKIVESISIPNVAIGGIHLDNISDVMKTGVNGVAVISEILGNEDIFEATKNLKKYVNS